MRQTGTFRASIFMAAGLMVLAFSLSARAEPDLAGQLAEARDAYKAVTSQPDEAALAKHADKQWAQAKATAADAEAKAKAGDSKAAIELYRQARKQAKDAIDLAAYAAVARAGAAAADDARTKANLKQATPLLAAMEKETDLYAARDLLIQLEELIPAEPRMPAIRQKVKDLPIPKHTSIRIGKPHRAVELKLVQVPAGTFIMGAAADEPNRSPDEGPPREVTISKPFYMGIYEVTQDQWDAALRDRPSGKEPNLPVVDVTKEDIATFCKLLCDAKSKRTVRLPTEAEWEYACRAGSKTAYSFGNNESDIGEYAWCSINSERKIQPPGQKKPNAFGLFDMHGNVFEWVSDRYADSYPADKGTDPQGPESGASAVARGGSWRTRPQLCRSAYRYVLTPDARSSDLGLRVVVTWDLD